MQIPILNGVYTDPNSDFRASYPRNLVPVASPNGISNGYLRPGPGIVKFGTGPGVDRGAINWRDECYRVMGTDLIKIDSVGNFTTIGSVGGSGQVSLTYGINNLVVVSGGNFFVYDGSTFQQNTASELAGTIDTIWIDSYFMTTDGERIWVTDPNNPLSVNPLNFQASDIDPDAILGLENIRNEAYICNRNSIEIFDNIATDGFPFQRIKGAQIEKGVIGTHAKTVFMQRLCFVGSGRNEAPSVYMANNGQAVKIATVEIDRLLKTYTETQLSNVLCETRKYDNHEHFWIHLPDKTLVYDGIGSQLLGQPIWFTLDSGLSAPSQYRARNLVFCYDKWLCGDPITTNHGYLVDNIGSHYDTRVGWEFGTTIIYNESRGAIIHEVELVALTGAAALGDDPTIYTQYSLDGQLYSMPKGISSGLIGERSKRLSWRRQANMEDRRIQRFTGNSDSHVSFSRLNMRIEALYV